MHAIHSLNLSTLRHTWLIDLDGTVVAHNGYLFGGDSLLPGVTDFFNRIPADDKVILLTARQEKYRKMTIEFLRKHNLRFDEIIFDLPTGERIVINDTKPKGLNTAISLNLHRDAGLAGIEITISNYL